MDDVFSLVLYLCLIKAMAFIAVSNGLRDRIAVSSALTNPLVPL